MALRSILLSLALCLLAPGLALADTAPFDLAGPVLRVTVTRGAVTLPISQVPNLASGDQLWIRAELPAAQSVRYILVVAFLRGATNPPPPAWFHRLDTWTRKGQDGLRIVTPAGAEQAIVLLAPQTGGDFDTLTNAVRGRPGAFVRASQDLVQASLDRSRLDAFLAALRQGEPGDPDRLATISPLLARSLAIRLNTDCLDKMPELQAACLMQGQDSLVLSDGHSASIVQALTSTSTTDLALSVAATPQASFGYYSPYIAAVIDIARILDSFHTAQYQYIPALATAKDDRLQLLLNTPPSFHNPQSVLVAALPPIEPPQPPPLEPVDAKAAYCIERPDLVLPIEGAPLTYSTAFAHDLVLRTKDKEGRTVDLPVRPAAEKGGFIVDTSAAEPARFAGVIEGAVHGEWGFEPFDGPVFALQNAHAAAWRASDEDRQALVVGRDDVIHLDGETAACVDDVSLDQPSGDPRGLVWKAAAPDRLSVTIPLANADPGPISLSIGQYGLKTADRVTLQAFAQAGKLDSFTLHVGELSGVLKGARLDEVAKLVFDGIDFSPDGLRSIGGGDELTLITADAASAGKLAAGRAGLAKVELKDGQTLSLKAVVAPPRPEVALIGKSVHPAATTGSVAIKLTDPSELPQNAVLAFSLRAQRPERFTGRETIEVATMTGGASTTLTMGNGLTLEDPQVLVATLDAGKSFGPSAFGTLQFRIIDGDDAGEWRPLAALVRLPALKALKCREGPASPCELIGSNLYLIDSVASDPGFSHAIKAPEGFPGYALSVPHPTGGKLYIRLHDAPWVVNQASFAE
jgi:hypothetical protein